MERLSFQDGFYFGCGFFAAGLIAYFATILVLGALFFLASLVFGAGLIPFLN